MSIHAVKKEVVVMSTMTNCKEEKKSEFETLPKNYKLIDLMVLINVQYFKKKKRTAQQCSSHCCGRFMRPIRKCGINYL